MIFKKLASAIYNDVVSGLRGFTSNLSMSLEQLEDDIVDERLTILKEYSAKGILPVKDLLLSINCINVDCKNIEKCKCSTLTCATPTAHFEIPQLLNDYGQQAIDYIGSVDKQLPFLIYTSRMSWQYSKYRKRGKNRPFVWIDTTPNENNMYDCFIFNAPLIKQVAVIAIFKDPRQLEQIGCCEDISDDNMSFINSQIKERVARKKINYYRSLAEPVMPNNQVPKT